MISVIEINVYYSDLEYRIVLNDGKIKNTQTMTATLLKTMLKEP